VDEKNRVVYFLGVGKERGRDPYFIHLYRIGFDGKNLALLTPEDATHDVSMSPSGAFSPQAIRNPMFRPPQSFAIATEPSSGRSKKPMFPA
jgi:hypothetical protein